MWLSRVALALAQDTALNPGEIFVSCGFAPISEEDYGRAVSVLTSDEIEERGMRTVQDALCAVPRVSGNGPGAGFSQLRFRGGEANHALILRNGVLLSASDSEYILSGVQTTNIERIVVLRRLQSVF